jgi:hypothetical protein
VVDKRPWGRLSRFILTKNKIPRHIAIQSLAPGCFAAFCGQTRKPGKFGAKRGTACMMAKLTGHVWSFDELFEAVLAPATIGE